MKPPTPDDEERQGMVLAVIIVGIVALLFLAWINSIGE
jgi:hypothetical protein